MFENREWWHDPEDDLDDCLRNENGSESLNNHDEIFALNEWFHDLYDDFELFVDQDPIVQASQDALRSADSADIIRCLQLHFTSLQCSLGEDVPLRLVSDIDRIPSHYRDWRKVHADFTATVPSGVELSPKDIDPNTLESIEKDACWLSQNNAPMYILVEPQYNRYNSLDGCSLQIYYLRSTHSLPPNVVDLLMAEGSKMVSSAHTLPKNKKDN